MVLSTERVTREDLVLFINACFACNGQSDFYSPLKGQEVSIRFLHEYVRGNYRRLYARTLAAGINHFNQGWIVVHLLAAGAPSDPRQREEEGALIRATLRRLPPQRAMRVLLQLRQWRVNNRRSRAVVKEYLQGRPDPAFDAVKYRRLLRGLVAHAHLRLPGELGEFLDEGARRRGHYQTPLLEAFRQAHHAQESIYALPYTIAEGLAAKHRVPRDEFLKKIEPRLTAAERLRLQRTAQAEEVKLDFDLGRAPLTRLALYALGLPAEERASRQAELNEALSASARRTLARTPLRLGRVAAVLDRSRSSWGSSEKRRRPLGLALAVGRLLREASREYRAFWTLPPEDELQLSPRGPTGLALPLLDALDWKPDLVVFVSDGYENDPAGGVDEVLRLFRERLDPRRTVSFVHFNPAFDSERYAPRTLSPRMPTLGLRDAEDLPTLLGFARFADGTAPLEELEAYLERRVGELLQ